MPKDNVPRTYKYETAAECPQFKPFRDNKDICQNCGSYRDNHAPVQLEDFRRAQAVRESFLMCLPVVAAILLIGEEEVDFPRASRDALELIRCCEEELNK